MASRHIKYAIPLALLIGAVLFLGGCTGKTPSQSTATPQPVVAVPAPESIIAEGRVVPVRGVALSFPQGGVIAEVPVSLGDSVAAGRLLARLETRVLEAQQAQAEANLAAAQARLAALKQGPTAAERAAAEQNLAAAQAAYESLQHPSAHDIAALRADVEKTKALLDQAQAAYDRIGGDAIPGNAATPQRAQLQLAWLDYQKAQALYDARTKPTAAQLQQALAAVENAKAQLARLQPTAAELATAQAAVDAAQAARDLVAAQVAQARLTAPFAGVITALDLRVGQYAAPGVPVLRLADTSTWQVETTDLTELSVVNVREGDPARVTFDAIPGLELPGRVARIQTYGESRQGDIVYTLIIQLDKQDPRLRWNMTAQVSIEPR